jgi:hypothetical protein
MPGSGDKIDYNLRPAKQIERKMLCESFRRLSAFQAIESYRYIGFGSFYFADFNLIHKSLGIRDMFSLELQAWKQKRFKFNSPFGCVKLRFGHSNELLDDFVWPNRRTILWLDYDDPLDEKCLFDVSFFCNNAASGSMLVVTVDAQTESEAEKLDERLSDVEERLTEDRIPLGITSRDLTGWGTAKLYHRIIMNEIAKVVSARNALLEKPEKFIFKQLFNFHYKDSAQMLTVGGLLYAQREVEEFQKCEFDSRSLKFIRSGVNAYNIELPRLTYREIRHLDAQLPCEATHLKAKGVKRDELRKYAKVYRWFPSLAEDEM